MSDREKLLGIIVGTLLGAFAIFGIYRMVNRGIEDKRNEITTLSTKLMPRLLMLTVPALR